MTNIEALKTISADSMDPFGKNETLFLKFEACIWSPEPFLQNWSKMGAKIANFAISQYFKKQFAPSGPDFYAISKMGCYISVL